MLLRQATQPYMRYTTFTVYQLPRMQGSNGMTHTHCHAGQQQPGLAQRGRLPEIDGAKSCQQSDQVGLYLVGIHQMAHTSDKQAYYSCVDPGRMKG